jgi:hypothetical protein
MLTMCAQTINTIGPTLSIYVGSTDACWAERVMALRKHAPLGSRLAMISTKKPLPEWQRLLTA